MQKQLIISVSREFGSGGHIVADHLAKSFELPLYDSNLLKNITNEKQLNLKSIEKYDELPKNPLFSRTVRGYSNSPEENIATMQFEYLKNKAKQGESFVIVGRCSETVLKGYPGLVSIFITADRDKKIERISQTDNLSLAKAEALMKRRDRERKAYHDYYSEFKWGDVRNYDITINLSRLGIDKTAKMLEGYIRERIAEQS